MLLDPPARLPAGLGHLSASSLMLWFKCREKWRRRYIANEFEPMSAAALLGRTVGAAERDHYSAVIADGRGLSTDDVLDAFADAWALEQERPDAERIDWQGEKPGRVKDKGTRLLPVYHHRVAPTVKPIAVEREFTLRPAGVEWTFTGFMDVEESDAVNDLKVRSRSRGVVTAAEARLDLQATSYTAARRAEGSPARFRFHSMVHPDSEGRVGPRDVLVTDAPRTDPQLDEFISLLYRVAAEIDFAVNYDVWTPPPPGVWWCSPEWCGFWSTCKMGGAFASPLVAPRPARKPRASQVRAAIEATRVQAGFTTAAKVATYLGVSTRSASALLNAEARAGRVISTKPTKSTGRGKDKVTVEIRGPQHYRLPPPDVDATAVDVTSQQLTPSA